MVAQLVSACGFAGRQRALQAHSVWCSLCTKVALPWDAVVEPMALTASCLRNSCPIPPTCPYDSTMKGTGEPVRGVSVVCVFDLGVVPEARLPCPHILTASHVTESTVVCVCDLGVVPEARLPCIHIVTI